MSDSLQNTCLTYLAVRGQTATCLVTDRRGRLSPRDGLVERPLPRRATPPPCLWGDVAAPRPQSPVFGGRGCRAASRAGFSAANTCSSNTETDDEHAHSKTGSAAVPGRARAGPAPRGAWPGRHGGDGHLLLGPRLLLFLKQELGPSTGPEGPPWSPCPAPRRPVQSVSSTEPTPPCAQPACVTGHVGHTLSGRSGLGTVTRTHQLCHTEAAEGDGPPGGGVQAAGRGPACWSLGDPGFPPTSLILMHQVRHAESRSPRWL